MPETAARFLAVCPLCATVYSVATPFADCSNCDLSIVPRRGRRAWLSSAIHPAEGPRGRKD